MIKKKKRVQNLYSFYPNKLINRFGCMEFNDTVRTRNETAKTQPAVGLGLPPDA